jgi:exopolysaccharide production protein ExoQ
VTTLARASRPALNWRTLEWWGAVVSLLLLSGAIFPLLMLGPAGDLSEAARSKLRLFALPVYLIAIGFLARHPGQFLAAVRRSLPLVLLLSMPVLSVLWSLGPSVSLRRAIGLIGSTFLAYFLATRFSPRQIMLVLGTAIVSCMVLSLLLMVAAPGLAFMPGGTDARGVYVHKNVLGWQAALACLITAVMITDRSLGLRRAGVPLFAASIACLLASKSMTGMLAAGAAAGLACFFAQLSRRQGIGRLVLVLIFLQLTAAFLLGLGSYLVPLLEALGKDATLTGRVPLWRLVDEQIGRNLVLGHGFGAFWTTGSPGAWRIWGEIGWMAPHAHNGFRDTLLGVGLLGLTILLFVIARAVTQGALLQCRKPDEGWLWLNVLVGMFLVMNLTESIFLVQNDLFWTLFMTAVIAFSLRYPDSTELRSEPGQRGNMPEGGLVMRNARFIPVPPNW